MTEWVPAILAALAMLYFGVRNLVLEDKIEKLQEIDDTLADFEKRGCPCTIIEPCHPSCTCACAVMSRGCGRCCRYGSKEQRTKMAEFIASKVDDQLPPVGHERRER